MKSVIILLIVLHYFVQVNSAYRILGVFTMPAYSHYALGSRLMRELAERGHDVTIITPYREKNPPKNYREIFMEGVVQETGKESMEHLTRMNVNPKLMIFIINFLADKNILASFEHPSVKKFLSDPNEKFDLVIVQQALNDAQKVFAHHFNAPLVVLSTLGSGFLVNPLVGNPAPRSFVADVFTAYNGTMNFWQRMDNLFMGFLEQIAGRFLLFPKMNKIVQQIYPGAPSVEEMNRNVSLVLLNSHPSINQPVPHVPNMIEVGGFHVYPPKPLPPDLKEYLDNATEGVVYFSMGSHVKSKYLPDEKRDGILKAFSKLKEKVLWKFEDDNLPGKPDNLKIGKWLPQQDILAHPNVKLFVTHGGLLSTIETIYHGVPLVGIPVFGDQKLNMANSVSSGFGVLVDYADVSEETLSAAIKEVLTNPKYRENAKARSRIMHDQPITPLDSAMFWIEYVVRHKGAPHFRSSALDLYWYQYYLLDVIAFLVVTAVAASYIFYLALRAIFRKRKMSPSATSSKKLA